VGGLRAVVVTETIQTVILLGGAVLVTFLAVRELPKHGVHSWSDFNMKVDVQHSSESLERASAILTGVDWLIHDADSPESLQALGESGLASASQVVDDLTGVGSVASPADLMWAHATELLESEKLGFVATVLAQTGHEPIATVFEDQGKWETIGSVSNLLAAASALRAEAKRVDEVGDMKLYLETDLPVRTPRLSMLRAQGPYFWLAILLGYPILGIWYWCSDQTIVQRVLGAKDQKNAQQGALFAGLLKITPVFLMVLPGTIAYVILRDQIGDDSPKTLPVLIGELMPSGLKGVMAAALMAALMSTIAAALNSVGTLVAKDIVGHFRPQTSDANQVRIGRISALVLMLVAMAWSTQGGKFGTIFEIINKIPALFLAPPITTVFLWGVFWRRGTKQAAVTILILGLTVGFALFLIDTKQVAGREWISDPRFGLGIPFMLQAVYMFCIWSVVYVVVSLLTPAPSKEQVERTTWSHPWAVITQGKLTGFTDPRAIAAALFVLMAVLYMFFS